MKPSIERSQVVVCDGQRPMGAIIPRGGKYEAHLASGPQLGTFDNIADARRAILDADRQRGVS